MSDINRYICNSEAKRLEGNGKSFEIATWWKNGANWMKKDVEKIRAYRIGEKIGIRQGVGELDRVS